jgi:hypothetical protein
MQDLPPTFPDAVQLSRALGIAYLWIDSLCIIQDDADDWAREAGRMADVYRSATLTLSADAAADCNAGLFQPVNRCKFPASIKACCPASNVPDESDCIEGRMVDMTIFPSLPC